MTLNNVYWTIRSVRLLTSYNGKGAAKLWLESLCPSTIPLRMFTIRYDRSSGPGGQNVNKVNSKCTLTLQNFSTCPCIPGEIRRQLMERPFRYYAKSSDSLVIQSDEARSRETNKHACLLKLVKEIKNSCWFAKEVDGDTLKKWDKIKKKAQEERVREKKFNAERKKSRSKTDFKY